MILDKLNEINWEKYNHAVGPAVDTPDDLRRLASTNPVKQEDGFYGLTESIYCNGRVYPAAIPAIPFLIEILLDPRIKNKHLVLKVLFLLGIGKGWHINHEYFLRNQFQELVGSEKFQGLYPDLEDTIRQEWDLVEAVHSELARYFDIYLQMLNNGEPSARIYVSHLLLIFPEFHETSIPKLIDRLDIEVDPQVKANILHVVGRLGNKRHQSLFERYWRNEKLKLPQSVALAWFVSTLEDESPDEALEALKEVLLTADKSLVRQYNELPSIREFTSDMAIPLALASSQYAEQILPWYTQHVTENDSRIVNDYVAIGLLTLALLPQGKKSDLSNLSILQREAVLAIAEKAWPTPKEHYVSTIKILEMFGLPGHADELSALLGADLTAKGWQAR